MKKLSYLLVLTTMFLVSILGCKKKDFDPDFDLPRQFKPGDISITAGEIEAQVRWDPSLFTQGKDVTYTVQLSKDSSFQGPIVLEQVVDTAFITLADDVLEVMEYYFVRVKANALGSTAVTRSSPGCNVTVYKFSSSVVKVMVPFLIVFL